MDQGRGPFTVAGTGEWPRGLPGVGSLGLRAGALGQFLAYLAHRHGQPVGQLGYLGVPAHIPPGRTVRAHRQDGRGRWTTVGSGGVL